MFVERSTQYTSFSSRKQPANAGTERKQFKENASVALQQPILTHAHTKCPPVRRAQCVQRPVLRLTPGLIKAREEGTHAGHRNMSSEDQQSFIRGGSAQRSKLRFYHF